MSKAIFFDLDGTLADTDLDIRNAWKATLTDLKIYCPDFDEKFIAGPPIDEMAKILFPELITPELINRLKTGFAAHYDNDGFPSTREYPGVIDAVRSLKNGGRQVFIVTNKRFKGATAMSRHFGWDRLFDGLYTGDMYLNTPIGKLRKDALIKHILNERALFADDCVIVGDTILDFNAGRANGVRSIGVTWGYGTADELQKADITVSSVDSLLEQAR